MHFPKRREMSAGDIDPHDSELTREVWIDGPHLEQSALCEPILRALPDWFGIESSIVQYVRDIEVMPTFLARTVLDGEVIGFCTIHRHFEQAAEVHVIGVRSKWHGRGVGSSLLGKAEQW